MAVTKTIADYTVVVPDGTELVLIQRGDSYYAVALNSMAPVVGYLVGHGPPAPALGSPGQTYVDDDTGDFYWKSSSGWHP